MNQINHREKALEIINKQGILKWLEVKDEFNLQAAIDGYCVDIEGCCEEDRCDCVKYRGLTLEEAQKKLQLRKTNG